MCACKTDLQSKGSRVAVAKVDATLNPTAASQNGVKAYPTIFFMKNRKGNDLDTVIEVPASIIILLRLELLIIIIMPILATYMSLGIGTF